MSVLVMDGVRRRRLEGSNAISFGRIAAPKSAAAVLELPANWSGQSAVFDGLRRVAKAPVTDPYTQPVTALPDSDSPIWRLATWATIPMLAAAGVIGTRAAINFRTATLTHAAAVPAPARPVSAADQAAIAPVSTSLQHLVDDIGQSGTYSLFVKDLKTGQLAVSTPDRVMYSASLYKLFVADTIYQRIDTGSLSYANQAGGGTGNTIGGCLNLMITISDNGCGLALGSMIGWNNLTPILHQQGYSSTDLSGTYTTTTARDVALLYERLYAGTLLSPDSTNNFFGLLKAQRINDRLPQGLPAGTSFAHKTGDLDGHLHDAGIVFGPKTDYLVVMMGLPGANANDFATASQQLWQHFSQ